MRKRIKLFKELKKICSSKGLFFICFFQFLQSLTVSALPFVYTFYINDVLITKVLKNYIFVISGYLIIFLIQTILVILNKKISNTLYIKQRTIIKKQVLKKYINMSYNDYSSYDIGDLNMRLDSDIESVVNFFRVHIVETINSLLMALIIAVILIIFDWRLAIISFCSIPVTYYVSKWIGEKANKVYKEYREKYAQYEAFLFYSMSNWKDIKCNNLEEIQDKKMKEKWKEISKLFIKNQIYYYCNMTFVAFKDLFLSNVILYFIGGLLIICDYLFVGTLLSFIKFYASFYTYLSTIMQSVFSFNNDIVNIEKVKGILELQIEDKKWQNFDINSISMENVCFKYNDDNSIFENANLLVNKPGLYSLVGSSGCGKTTLFKLLLGEYKVDSGKVLIGNKDVTEIRSDYLHKKIGIVTQEPVFFNISLRDNFLLLDYKLTDEEIKEACKEAGLEDFIESLPEKYNTIIGEKGIKLSGGQRQRLAIARMLLGQYKIVLLDECTSALDGENERRILELIKNRISDKICLIISHRESTIRSADHMILVDKRKTTEISDFNSLYSSEGVLYNI